MGAAANMRGAGYGRSNVRMLWKLNFEDMVRALNIAFLVFMLLSLFFLDGDGVATFPSTSPCCCCGSFNSSLHANNLHLRRWIALVFVRQRTDSIPASEVAASAARLDSVRVLHNLNRPPAHVSRRNWMSLLCELFCSIYIAVG